MADPARSLSDLPACPRCGDPGFVNPNTDRRQCGNAGCDFTDDIEDGREPFVNQYVHENTHTAVVAERDRLRAQLITAHDALREIGEADSLGLVKAICANGPLATAPGGPKEDECFRLRAEIERLRDLGELAVMACLPLLPLRGSATSGYEVEREIEPTLRALPQEWAEAAWHIAALNAALEGLPEPPVAIDEQELSRG